MAFVFAKTGPANYGNPERMFSVQYFDENGNMTIRSGGTRAWRCNNPGNLHRSRYSMSKKRGAIGFAGDDQDEYAVYPNYETGHQALVVMLKGSVYSPLTLREAMQRYEPKKKDYIDIIVDKTGLDPERKVNSLNDREFKSFWQAIEDTEKWEVGRDDFVERWYIAGVHKSRNTIYEYLVEQKKKNVWYAKNLAIKLAEEERLRATVVHMKNGKKYLRPEHGSKPFQVIV